MAGELLCNLLIAQYFVDQLGIYRVLLHLLSKSRLWRLLLPMEPFRRGNSGRCEALCLLRNGMDGRAPRGGSPLVMLSSVWARSDELPSISSEALAKLGARTPSATAVRKSPALARPAAVKSRVRT